MGNVTFKLDINGLRKIMKSKDMERILGDAGHRVASTASGGQYGSRVHKASYTSIANIYVADEEAAESNLENNTLLKALGQTRI